MAWLVGFLFIIVGFLILWAESPIGQLVSDDWRGWAAFMVFGGLGILAVKSIMFFIDYAKKK